MTIKKVGIQESDHQRICMLRDILKHASLTETIRYLVSIGETLVAAKVTKVEIEKSEETGNIKVLLI